MDWSQVIIAIVGGAVSGLFTGGMAWGAIRRDIHWLIEERKRHETEISDLSKQIGRLYGRVDQLNGAINHAHAKS